MATNSLSGNQRAIFSTFEKYQKERLSFVQSVADYASKESNVEILQSTGVMFLLRPLLMDNVPAIQQAAALALGRLANYNEELATAVVDGNILPQLVFSLAEQNRFYKKAAAFVLRAVAKHTPELAKAVVSSGALEALVGCLEDFDPGVKESAAWALGYIARHNAELAQAIVNANGVPLLVLCVQEPEISLKRIAASALGDIAKHTPELAQAIVDANSISFLTPLLTSPDAKLRRQVCSALSQIAKHTVDLAEVVVDGEIFPSILNCFKDMDGYVRKNAATLICEIAKHTPELAQLIVNSGGVGVIVDYVNESHGNARLPGVMTLGYIAAFSETLALAVIVANGVPPLVNALTVETEEHIKAACAWALGQIGRHSPDHAKNLADNGILPKLLHILTGPGSEEIGADLRNKTKRALKCILEKTLHMPALEPLLQGNLPTNLLKYVICQFAKILPNDVSSRRAFVTCGGLQRVQDIAAAQNQANALVGTKLGEYIRNINECYPEEIIRYYSPGYSSTLLDKIEEYSKLQELSMGTKGLGANVSAGLPPLPGVTANSGNQNPTDKAADQSVTNQAITA